MNKEIWFVRYFTKHSEVEKLQLACPRCLRGIITGFHAMPMENEALVYCQRREDSRRIRTQLPQDSLLTARDVYRQSGVPGC